MRIRPCAKCGGMVEASGAACPLCGTPVRASAPVGIPVGSAPEALPEASESGDMAARAVESKPAADPLVPYQFSCRCSPAGFLTLSGIGLVSAALVGVLYHFLAKVVDMPLLSALLVGGAAGLLLLMGVRLGKCRNKMAAVTVALFCGFLAYGARYVADSQELRPKMVRSFAADVSARQGMPPAVARARVDHALNPWRTLPDLSGLCQYLRRDHPGQPRGQFLRSKYAWRV